MLETSRRLGEVDRELIAGVIKSMYALLAADDIAGLLKLMAPNVVCFPKTTWGGAHFSRRIEGKDAVSEALAHRHINYVCKSAVVQRVLIDGDSASVHRSITLRERGSGVVYNYDSVDFLRFRDGLIVEFCSLPDGRGHDAVVNFPH